MPRQHSWSAPPPAPWHWLREPLAAALPVLPALPPDALGQGATGDAPGALPIPHHAAVHGELQHHFSHLLERRRNFEIYSPSWVNCSLEIADFFSHHAPAMYDLLSWNCPGCGHERTATNFNMYRDVCTTCFPADTSVHSVSYVRDRLHDLQDAAANGEEMPDSDEDERASREINRYIHEDHLAQPCLAPIGRPPYFGVELEVESTLDMLVPSAKQTGEIFDDFAIIKRDGSLRCGFEICTRPASFKEHCAQWKRFFAASGQIPIQIMDSCGLHVHCSRRGLSDLTVAKIVCFINAYHNRRFIRCIAGRSENNYAQIKKKKLTNASVWTGDRYEAVNIGRCETIEFRMFRGTLDEATFFKALEFCDAMRAFCSPEIG